MADVAPPPNTDELRFLVETSKVPIHTVLKVAYRRRCHGAVMLDRPRLERSPPMAALPRSHASKKRGVCLAATLVQSQGLCA